MNLEKYIIDNWTNEGIENAARGMVIRDSALAGFPQNLALQYCEEENITHGDLLKASDRIHVEYQERFKTWLIFCVINIACRSILRKNEYEYNALEKINSLVENLQNEVKYLQNEVNNVIKEKQND